ncbi:MAG: NAD(P)-dependent oxidoreductase [Gammaproteobacteria bacterium]|nr:NAD(P)-dependent oxidoreductase [Gammaproteobacteria bacterium]
MCKKILIIGASGFIGSNLTKKLQSTGSIISTFSKKKMNIDGCHEYTGDIRDSDSIRRVVQAEQPTIVYHLASLINNRYSVNNVRAHMETNIIGTINVMSALRYCGNLELLCMLGTALIDQSDRSNIYAASKACQRIMLQLMSSNDDIPTTILNPGIAFGPGQRGNMLIPSLISALSQKRYFNMTEGLQTRDFLYIDDLVEAMILLIDNKNSIGMEIEIGSGEALKVADVANFIAKELNAEEFLNLGGLNYKKNEVMNYSVNNEMAREILSWRPKVNIYEGIRRTIDSWVVLDERV